MVLDLKFSQSYKVLRAMDWFEWGWYDGRMFNAEVV